MEGRPHGGVHRVHEGHCPDGRRGHFRHRHAAGLGLQGSPPARHHAAHGQQHAPDGGRGGGRHPRLAGEHRPDRDGGQDLRDHGGAADEPQKQGFPRRAADRQRPDAHCAEPHEHRQRAAGQVYGAGRAAAACHHQVGRGCCRNGSGAAHHGETGRRGWQHRRGAGQGHDRRRQIQRGGQGRGRRRERPAEGRRVVQTGDGRSDGGGDLRRVQAVRLRQRRKGRP